MFSDLRYAFRTLGHSPAFTSVAVIVLALGIGANTAIFSVIDAVLLRPLAYRETDRLAMLWQRFTPEVGGGRLNISPPEYVEYGARATSRASLGAGFQNDFNLTDGDEPERVRGALITSSLFETWVVSYSVAQQSREIGIRRALGAQRRDVMALVVGQGARVTIGGLALGVGGALLVTRALSRLLYGVTATVDPMQALRSEG